MPHVFEALQSRGVIALSGADARAWLDNLVTNDLALLDKQPSVFAGLLTPQGKLLFEFFVISHGDDLLIETHAASVAALIKRLTLYKLRAQIALREASSEWVSVWAEAAGAMSAQGQGAIVFADPRAPSRLWRGLMPAGRVVPHSNANYTAARIALGLAEAPDDYVLGDTFPHEANFDRHAGVSFTKGCFVGQEVVARMQNKSVVRKRVVRVVAAGALTSGADITTGAATIGKIGSVAGNAGLALLRLDRAVEAIAKGDQIAAGASALTVDAAALEAYRHAVANRPEIDL
jgi:tRNA-modifying protein YgfZ